MKRVPKRSWFVLLLLLQTILGTGIGLFVTNYYYSFYDLFLPGTTVLGKDVAGLDIEQVEELLMEELLLPENFSFLFQEKEFTLPLHEGVIFFDLKNQIEQAFLYGERQDLFDVVRWSPNERSIHVYLEIDSTFLEEGIDGFRPLIDRDPVDAELIIQRGVPFVRASKLGYALDLKPSLENVRQAVRQGEFQKIPLIVEIIEPEVSEEDIPDFSYRRAFYKTSLDENEERNHNIALSLIPFHSIILEPQDEISFNEMVGRVSKDAGYLTSIIIMNNRFVEGVGGGICQVATTLYQVALRGELEILERSSHSREVQYVPGGFDAAISYNALDLRFRNDKDFPLLLTSYLHDSITISLYGPRVEPGRKVEISNELVQRIPPPIQEVEDPDLPIGQERVIERGESGSHYRVYRSIFIEEELESRQLISTDYYQPLPKIVAVGTKLLK